VSKNHHKKKLSEYRRCMAIREGLSFSDYFDDSVPYEVKPVPSTIPMQEEESDYIGHSDIPTQSKDLFKGLWEVEELKNGYSSFWLDKEGKFYSAGDSHLYWAKDYLKKIKAKNEGFGVSNAMFKLGFLRIYLSKSFKEIIFEYHNNIPSYRQWSALKNSSIELGYNLRDGIRDKQMELTESLLLKNILKDVNRDDKCLFIESMMPDNMDTFKSHLAQLFDYLQKRLKLKTVPKVRLLSDEKNADKVLGKTAYYDCETKTVNLYTTNRHQKDILRSFAHEVIHHWQHENKQLDKNQTKEETSNKDPRYAQNDPWLRQMEKQAYLLGNMLFRDWEDQKKEKDRKSNKKMVEKTSVIGTQYPPRNQTPMTRK